MNALDKSRRTPLHVAGIEDKSALISVLLQSGADPDLADLEQNNGKHFLLFGIISSSSVSYVFILSFDNDRFTLRKSLAQHVTLFFI